MSIMRRIANRLDAIGDALGATGGRVSVVAGSAADLAEHVIEVVGIPDYVDDVTDYAQYSITEPGWYIFPRVNALGDTVVTEQTTVTGAAGYVAEAGAGAVELAVRFGVTAETQVVTIDWGPYTDTLIFKASDLAIRNLDYRTTFYIYDLAPFVTWEYALTEDPTFAEGKNYYTKDGDVYTLAEVTAGESVPAETYYNHSKLHIEGMTRNITYRLDEIVDCPSEIVLPEIEGDTHGAWFEMQMRHSDAYSMTLLPPEGVKVATEHTQAETAGMNMIDLHYLDVDGVKLWRFMNTHSSIPTT